MMARDRHSRKGAEPATICSFCKSQADGWFLRHHALVRKIIFAPKFRQAPAALPRHKGDLRARFAAPRILSPPSPLGCARTGPLVSFAIVAFLRKPGLLNSGRVYQRRLRPDWLVALRSEAYLPSVSVVQMPAPSRRHFLSVAIPQDRIVRRGCAATQDAHKPACVGFCEMTVSETAASWPP